MKTVLQGRVIDFMKLRKLTGVLSIAAVLVSFAFLVMNQVQFGLDFTGGTEIRLQFPQPTEPSAVRQVVSTMALNGVVKQYGSEFDILIQLPPGVAEPEVRQLIGMLGEGAMAPQVSSIDQVGPQVGDELREQGGMALLAAMLLVMAYVAFRFQFKFAVGAVVALLHDVIITLGCYAILGWEFDLTVLAALLALIGYSINDTIVVFDRIRENFRKYRKMNALEVCNVSLTQTLGRTIGTSLTVVLVLLAMFFVGGPSVHEFSRTLLIGVLVGTYSSIYVAASVLISMKVSSQDLIVHEQNRKELEEGVV